MKKLHCHTSLKDANGEYMVKEGEIYPIVCETLIDYEIIDEQGFEHEFTKTPDDNGLCFSNWFYLVLEPKSKPTPLEGFPTKLGEIGNKELPTYSENALVFELSDQQTDEAKQWMKEREKYVGAIGGQFSFTFTPTGLGTIVKLTDGEEELDLTDYDLW